MARTRNGDGGALYGALGHAGLVGSALGESVGRLFAILATSLLGHGRRRPLTSPDAVARKSPYGEPVFTGCKPSLGSGPF